MMGHGVLMDFTGIPGLGAFSRIFDCIATVLGDAWSIEDLLRVQTALIPFSRLLEVLH